MDYNEARKLAEQLVQDERAKNAAKHETTNPEGKSSDDNYVNEWLGQGAVALISKALNFLPHPYNRKKFFATWWPWGASCEISEGKTAIYYLVKAAALVQAEIERRLRKGETLHG